MMVKKHARSLWVLVLFTAFIVSVMKGSEIVQAQGADEFKRQVQVLTGRVESGTDTFYTLPDLKGDQTLYVRMEGTSGNLDPFLMLFTGDVNASELTETLQQEINRVIAEGLDPLIALPAIFDQLSLAWNDDHDEGFDAALEYTLPADGSYTLLVTNAPGTNTFGSYRLLVGLNEPQVMSGEVRPTGDTIAYLDEAATEKEVSVEEIRGVITSEQPKDTVTLRDLNTGDTLYAYVETTSGELAPVLVLRNFSGKPLRSGNISGEQSIATVQYLVERDISNYKLSVESFERDGEISTGEYRLLVGVNAPAVLSGEAEPQGRSPLKKPIEVRIGTELQQITGIDQQNEKFNAVATLKMEWQDPALAFSPDVCECDFITYTGDSFSEYADANDILWPEFTLHNQQGNRWDQNRNVVVWPDGRALYYERYTTDFQAPLFNFTRFPFDEQQLFIRVDSLLPEKFFTYTNPEALSGIGDQLGEEEWYVVSSDSQVTSEENHAVYHLNFNVARHLNFYIYRIFLPILLVILVSWLTFFMRDYGKRVDVASANLLVFVAFNFTISAELPRLGYLTFMDAVLIGAFVVGVVVILYNVVLKRLEVDGHAEAAERIDRIAIWAYPLLYAIGGLIVVLSFLT
ncbi:MAG: hypothetical protein U9R58_03980 [Chloroflexota bacterium]|nr:hypothetical protein [Chloroflexota bacterium]